MVHGVHLVHLDMTQSTGHVRVWHTPVSSMTGQRLPPWAILTVTVRTRLREPLPQLKLHGPHFENGDTMQSTGHLCVLQLTDSRRPGHALPPWAACIVIVRERDCVPHEGYVVCEQHERVHGVHLLHLVTSQSTVGGVGLGVGALVGALVGAMVGALVGAMVGAGVGQALTLHRRDCAAGHFSPP